MTKQHHAETVFAPDGIRVSLYSEKQAPIMVEKATGTASLKFKDGTTNQVALVTEAPKEGDKAVYFCPMHKDVVQMEPGICKQCGGMKLFAQDALFAKVDLSKVEPGTMKVTFHIKGLKGIEREATFTETFMGMGAQHEDEGEAEAHPHGSEGSMGSHH